MDTKLNKWMVGNRGRIIEDFKSYLSIDTSTTHEARAFQFLEQYLSGIGFKVNKQYLHPELVRHELFTPHKLSHIREDRFNIIARQRNASPDLLKKVLFNVHMDVVPAGEEFEEAFRPFVQDGFLYGRGACDTKNNLIMLVEAIRFLQDHDIELKKQIEIDLVIEEEISGSGTLSTIMHGIEADVVIVMEPTGLNVFRGHRGVITANIDVKGKSVHMGSIDTGVSAIECAFHLITRLKRLESELLEEARSNRAYSIWNKPLQVNIGMIKGGEWPGSVPERCQVTCNIGFLEDYSLSDIKSKIITACHSTVDNWTNENIEVVFDGLKNSAYLTNEQDPNLIELLDTVNRFGIDQQQSFGWGVSCDAHLYHTARGLPTLIFGSGNLSDAHSAHEKLDLGEMERGIRILVDYLAAP